MTTAPEKQECLHALYPFYSKAIVEAAGPAFFKTGLGGTWGLARMPLNWVDSQNTTKGTGQEIPVLQGVVRFARKSCRARRGLVSAAA